MTKHWARFARQLAAIPSKQNTTMIPLYLIQLVLPLHHLLEAHISDSCSDWLIKLNLHIHFFFGSLAILVAYLHFCYKGHMP